MKLENELEVLIVGAGPVGLWSALRLAENEIKVGIVDKSERNTVRNYACALHPSSLNLLDQAGLLDPILKYGCRIDKVAVYEGDQRRIELPLSTLAQENPFVVTFSQGRLEQLLENQLQTRGKIKVHWAHRLSSLEKSSSTVLATVDQLEETAKGYAVPHWEWVVKKAVETKASIVLGADGPNSHVRQVLNLKSDLLQPNRRVAVFEFVPDGETPQEMCLVLHDKVFSAFWPMPGGLCRWTFELAGPESSEDFPSKDTENWNVEHLQEDEETITHLKRLLHKRAPWFKAGIQKLEWSGEVIFPQRLVQSYGMGRCWLAGDAAHQTTPLASQSLNGGLLEASELTHHVQKILRENASLEILDQYNSTQRDHWIRLMKAPPQPLPDNQVPGWLRKHAKRFPGCLPALGEDLNQLLKLVGLHLA
jgi:NADPH-dependent dioxygenase